MTPHRASILNQIASFALCASCFSLGCSSDAQAPSEHPDAATGAHDSVPGSATTTAVDAGVKDSSRGATTSRELATTATAAQGVPAPDAGHVTTQPFRVDAGVGVTTAPTEGDSSEPMSSAEPNTPASDDALGAYPFDPSAVTLGGTMTFLDVGAEGWWPRRIEREAGDPACSYKDGSDTWGGHCCMEEHHTASIELAPFNEEMVLILKSLDVKQLAVYQPDGDSGSADWQRVTSWDKRTEKAENLWFTQQGQGNASFAGDLTNNDCVGYLSQEALLGCDDLDGYFCPDDSGIMHRGFSGSKLFVFLASMTFDDDKVRKCDGDGAGHPGPWVALVASELVRDGGRKWNGACNCYSRTGSVGDGCGEMNVFEVVLDNNEFSNREFMSTGVRSYQAGHVGGAVCGADCERDAFAQDVEVVDACAQTAYTDGPVLAVGGETTGCPVWRRPEGDRYFVLLLDEHRREIQVAVLHPSNVDFSLSSLLPALPKALGRADIDALLDLRLPE